MDKIIIKHLKTCFLILQSVLFFSLLILFHLYSDFFTFKSQKYNPDHTDLRTCTTRKTMKKVLIILLLCAVFQPIPDYTFELAWEGPSDIFLGLYIADLEDDGLSEIFYFHYGEEKEYILSVLDTFSAVLWEIQVDEYPNYTFFEDITGDGFKEIIFITRITDMIDEMDTNRAEWQIDCLNAEGTLLWTKTTEMDSDWSGYLGNRCNINFADINKDGFDEIMVANLILDRHGNTLLTYGDNYSISGLLRGDSQSEMRLILEKETEPYFTGRDVYGAFCRITTVDGTILWEKEFKKPTYLQFLEVEQKEKLFYIQDDNVTEVDLETYQENPRIKIDSDYMGEFVPLRFSIVDLDNDGEREYVLIILDNHSYGDSSIYVYDSEFQLVWEYTDHRFYATVNDLDNDGKYEFLIDYFYMFNFWCGGSDRTFFRVLNHDKSERWTIQIDFDHSTPRISDIDADGVKEIIFHVDLSPETCFQNVEDLEESQENSQDIFTPLETGKYLYIFDPEGVIEKQIDVSSGAPKLIQDLDGDQDLDMLYWEFEKGYSMRVYANTRFKGPLDEISGLETLEEVDLGERGFKRDFQLDPSSYYTYEKFRSFLRSPFHFLWIYGKKTTIPLSISVICGLAFSFFLVNMLTKRNDWEPVWGIKRVILFLVLSYFSPAALGYLGYVLVKKSADFKKGLGFVRITRKQLITAFTVGVFLFAIAWVVTLLLLIYDVDLPESNTEEQLEESFVKTVFELLIAAPIVEEALFAGFTYPILRKKMGIRMGIALNSFFFALIHLKPILIPLYFVPAVVKMYAYERTHCIYVPMIIHFVHNFFIVLMILL